MPKFRILADDLTGAHDAAGPLLAYGLHPEVVTHCGALRRQAHQADEAVTVNLATRHEAPGVAAHRVLAAVEGFGTDPALCFYKKTDSAARGNLAAELGAFQEALPGHAIIYAPALPAAGRSCEGGVLRIDGRPVAETEFGSDPEAPVLESSLSRLLAQEGLDVASFLPGTDAKAKPPKRGQFYLADGASEADLQRTARWACSGEVPVAFAGPAGLIRWLPEAMGFAQTPPPEDRLVRPLLVVNGSLTERSLAQVAAGLEAGFADWRIRPEDLGGWIEAASQTAIEAWIDQYLGAAPKAGLKGTILYSAQQRPDAAAYLEAARSAGSNDAGAMQALRDLKSRLAGTLCRIRRPGTLIVFGGEQSAAVLDALAVERYQLYREWESGIVELRLPPPFEGLSLLTKSGGLGHLNFLKQL